MTDVDHNGEMVEPIVIKDLWAAIQSGQPQFVMEILNKRRDEILAAEEYYERSGKNILDKNAYSV